MKANELRIGNFIYYGANERVLDTLLFLQLLKYTTIFEPIPLTKEWLLKFGIEKMHDGNYWNKKLCIRKDINEFYALYEQGRIYIQHVHQLQNLHFALTGEELTYGGNK
jgi:hypothetical protein